MRFKRFKDLTAGTTVGELNAANARIAELEAQLAEANARGDKFQWAFKVRCEQADERDSQISDQFTLVANAEREARARAEKAEAEAARLREEYEAKLAEAKRIWEVADEERATARAQLKEVQANWKKYEPIDGVNCPRQAALRPQESADAEAIKQNPRIVE